MAKILNKTINVTIRLDRDVKENAEKLFSDLGMNLSTAFNIFARQALRQRKIPFEIAEDPFFSDVEKEKIELKIEYLKKIDKSLEQICKDKIVTKTMKELEEMAK